MDYTIEKATELGIKTIRPLFSERCNVHLTGSRLEKRLEHWQKIAINAAEQSGRCFVPQIKPALNFITWLDQHKNIFDRYLKLVLAPNMTTSMTQLIKNLSQPKQNIILLTWPEGGFSAAEIKLADAHGFYPAKLGPRILRTETAAIVAISIMQSMLGDLS